MSDEQMSMDAANLYREDVYTDQKIGTIRVMTPVTLDGERDSAREVQFIGQAQMMTPAGALPLSFELSVDSLAGAVEAFADGAAKAVEDTMQELQEMRRQQASQIVVPGADRGPQIQMP